MSSPILFKATIAATFALKGLVTRSRVSKSKVLHFLQTMLLVILFAIILGHVSEVCETICFCSLFFTQLLIQTASNSKLGCSIFFSGE